MSNDAKSTDTSIREAALIWYKKKYPHRPLEEDKILAMYKEIQEYAQSDPLLQAYYAANRIAV